MMPDREKVIKGLEVCTSTADGESCPKDCPYYQEVCYGYNQLMRDALALMKKQKAKPPAIMQDIEGIWSTCSMCGHKLRPIFAMEMDTYFPKFCSECGQAVKWGR